MTDGFLWGGFNIRKFSRQFLKDLWMVIAVIIIVYLGLGFVDGLTYAPSYTSTAIAAVSPISSSYHHYSLETVSDLTSKANDVDSVFNSTMFQSGFHNQEPALQDCIIDSLQVKNTNILIMHSTSGNPKNAYNGIWAALDYYSQFSADVTGAPKIKILFGPELPILADSISKIMKHRRFLCAVAGMMMAGLLVINYVVRKTYKTERCIRKQYKNIRFFSLPYIKFKSDDKKTIRLKKNKQEPIKKVALEIKQVMHKCNKKTLFVTSYADKEGGNAFLSELTRELAEQNENVILIGAEAGKDARFYSEELKALCIQYSPDNMDEDVSYTVDDARSVLSNCLGYADIVLVNGVAWYPSNYAQIWEKAVDVSIALCRQEDADFFKVDQMLSNLQKGDSYLAGCVLFGF